jgi:hypothetical protein
MADYHDGILTVSVGLKIEEKEAVKKIEVSSAKKQAGPRCRRRPGRSMAAAPI